MRRAVGVLVKPRIVTGLDSLCHTLDGLPVLWRIGNAGRGHFLAGLAYSLDRRWGTGEGGSQREAVRGGSLSDMAWDLKPAADTGDDCLVHAPSVYDALMAADAEVRRLRDRLGDNMGDSGTPRTTCL